jgi:hypothetical protein
MADMKWILGLAAATVTMAGCGEDDPASGATSDGVTLNTSSWDGSWGMEALIVGVVRVDASGCVYLGSDRSEFVRDIAWPPGYTASRQRDGSVTISNADGVVVAATGRHIEFGGGVVPGVELLCRAKGPRDSTEPDDSGVVMVTDVLPPLNFKEKRIGRQKVGSSHDADESPTAMFDSPARMNLATQPQSATH